MSALHGRTVVVTRPRESGERLASAFARRGARPVLFPTIAIHPVADTSAVDLQLERLCDFDWLVFTSANAVTHTWSRVRALGHRLTDTLRVAAVGPGTARALEAVGVEVHAIPAVYQGKALAEALGSLTGHRVLVPRADIGREETVSALRAAGAAVVEVTVYSTVPANPDRSGLDILRAGADAITFTSPSTVSNFAALLGGEAKAILAGTTVACIGPTTAAAVGHAAGTLLVAAHATAESLVDLLEDHFARSTVGAGTEEGA